MKIKRYSFVQILALPLAKRKQLENREWVDAEEYDKLVKTLLEISNSWVSVRNSLTIFLGELLKRIGHDFKF